jgi:6-pyruvoyltetrahydropterin/6-carboxytetrahydropterin synthase
MWTLEKKFRFEASHVLPHHGGKCARLHGHSWNGVLVCEGRALHTEGSQAGMLVDFDCMKQAIEPLVEEYLDHYHLNDSTGLESPTSEALAQWIYDRVKPSLPMLAAVIIEETCTSRCTYRPE